MQLRRAGPAQRIRQLQPQLVVGQSRALDEREGEQQLGRPKPATGVEDVEFLLHPPVELTAAVSDELLEFPPAQRARPAGERAGEQPRHQEPPAALRRHVSSGLLPRGARVRPGVRRTGLGCEDRRHQLGDVPFGVTVTVTVTVPVQFQVRGRAVQGVQEGLLRGAVQGVPGVGAGAHHQFDPGEV